MNDLDRLDEFMVELSNYGREYCVDCLCSSCFNPDCEYSACDAAVVFDGDCGTSFCPVYETHGHYYYDDNGNEYWIGKDNRRHYTRNEG